MMRFFLIMVMIFCVNYVFAQKPVIDSIAYKQWTELDGPTISKNGQYVYYNIKNVPVGSKTLVVQSIGGKWKKEFKGGLKDGQQLFSDKYFLFVTKNDSLGMLMLGTDHIQYIPNTSWCNLKEIKGAEYLLYPTSHNSKDLVLKNLKTSKERVFNDVDSWDFDDDILILIKSKQGTRQSINLANITTGKISDIWEGDKPENLILDAKHKQLAFKTGDSVWYYKFGSKSAICISGKNSSDIEQGLHLGYLDSFSKDGKFLFTSLLGKREAINSKNGIVEIWSYTDVQLQAEQENALTDQKYLAVINLENRHVIRLQQQQGEWFQFSKSGDAKETFALIENARIGESWSVTGKFTWGLVSLENGQKKTLDFLDNISFVKLSPCGTYIIYFDRIKKNYFSYEIATERIRNLTKDISGITDIDTKWDNGAGMSTLPRGAVGAVWTKNDESILLYDQYDIWELDPLNVRTPVNITNGYGKKNGLIFHFGLKEYEELFVDKNETLILNCFDLKNKDNGYYKKKLGESGDPRLLNMGPYVFDLVNAGYLPGEISFSPRKAKNVNVYVVKKMSASNAPNYYSTNDFESFTQLSHLNSEKEYNWYRTELHSWKSLDGTILQGILYKPENFDPNKKYPVIFHYYQRKSDGLNCYIKPDLSKGNMDIPTFVSHSYLVFSPDIYYKEGSPMQGTYDAVVSAANYLATLPFINSKKMGIQGNSFGGVQTNYLVTHTNLFAAAESSSGLADFVSSYSSLSDGGTGSSEQGFHETGQPRMGGSLWARPEAYIKNSSIFQVHKVTTPLLLMHTKKDGIAGYQNIIEFFTGLRRMGKRAWMLVYSEGNHGVRGKEADDFSIRMMQFFDHYLKDKPAPLWMLDGVVAKDRSWKAGLELDTKGRTPGPGLLTTEEQKKVDSIMIREPITIRLN
ncbi:hypothetical protein DBR11_21460 [Pedobacter sp. HMWF019]|uniref:alpha/beta hydrolase family protein n=1 Tax=Pedobacter sp. HMWF019 TaxID=2056856 RepID=UPI000D33869F|nr:prolyl oligopeptidase family serine peptidase [Pedobacter sp. HMWF019]PTS95410.1 hypothetical protein DBR11_21460 [Pedobacter sp. HMWF019]